MADDDEPGGDDRGSENRGGTGKIVALVFVVVLAIFSVWLVNKILADVKLQNCVLSGRRDCAPINPGDTP